MQKNYYQLLQVSPQATAQEIKLAYRKLALKYHPDRNKGNLLTEAVFKEINEAYSVLSNAEKRKFYNASIAVQHLHSGHKRQAPVTAQSILQEAVKLKKTIEKSNALNINQDIVFYKIQALLSGFNLHLLLLENNPSLRQQFIQQVLLCMQPLRLNAALPLMLSLQKVAAKDEEMLQEIHVFYKQKKSEAFWQRYKLLFVFIIALLLCLLMYLL